MELALLLVEKLNASHFIEFIQYRLNILLQKIKIPKSKAF